jgi:hypothetical protein
LSYVTLFDVGTACWDAKYACWAARPFQFAGGVEPRVGEKFFTDV